MILNILQFAIIFIPFTFFAQYIYLKLNQELISFVLIKSINDIGVTC